MNSARFLGFDDGAGFRLVELRPRNVIGSGINATIALERPGVAARHAVVLVHDDGTEEVTDDRSPTGTWVNGARVRRRRLQHGDELTIGGVTLGFVCEPALARDNVVELRPRRAARRYRRSLAAAAAALLLAAGSGAAVADDHAPPSSGGTPVTG